MLGTGSQTTVPRGYPPEAHVVSVSKPIAVALLLLYAAGVGVSVWCLLELRSVRQELQSGSRDTALTKDGE